MCVCVHTVVLAIYQPFEDHWHNFVIFSKLDCQHFPRLPLLHGLLKSLLDRAQGQIQKTITLQASARRKFMQIRFHLQLAHNDSLLIFFRRLICRRRYLTQVAAQYLLRVIAQKIARSQHARYIKASVGQVIPCVQQLHARTHMLKKLKATSLLQQLLRFRLARNLHANMLMATAKLQEVVRTFSSRKEYSTHAIRGRAAQKMQAIFRCCIQQRKYMAARDGFISFQVRYRRFNREQEYKKDRCNVIKLQAKSRCYCIEKLFQLHKVSTTTVQAHARSFLRRREYSFTQGRIIKLQSFFRAFLQQHRYQQMWHRLLPGLTQLQATWRGRSQKKRYADSRARIVTLQAVYRGFFQRKQQAAHAKTAAVEEEAKKKSEDERLKKEKEAAEAKKVHEDAATKKAEEDERKQKKTREIPLVLFYFLSWKKEMEERRRKEEEAARTEAETETARKKAEEEAARLKAEQDTSLKKQAEEAEAKLQVEEEVAARKKAEEEAARLKAEAEAARKKAEEEAAQQAAAVEEAEYLLKVVMEEEVASVVDEAWDDFIITCIVQGDDALESAEISLRGNNHLVNYVSCVDIAAVKAARALAEEMYSKVIYQRNFDSEIHISTRSTTRNLYYSQFSGLKKSLTDCLDVFAG
jgi:chemotaxis protein histidine kinase CheA